MAPSFASGSAQLIQLLSGHVFTVFAPSDGGAKVDVTYTFLTGVHIGTAKEMAHVQNSDIHAINGVIHVIDKVILP
jgi:uncharacterized surface protein with fasciclin (FAS1) repeats